MPGGELRDQVRGRRGEHGDVRLAGEADVDDAVDVLEDRPVDGAAGEPSNVAGPTNRAALSVSTAWTVAPAA
jgi:hypothetical protein